MILKNAMVLDSDFVFRQKNLSFSSTIGSSGETGGTLDCSECYAVPGLVDAHTHGALGFDANDNHLDYDAWQQFLLKNGVTTFLPTTATDNHENLLSSFSRLHKAVGINMEGPYLSVPKRGAHAPEKIREVDLSFLKQVKNRVKIVTIAPENGENLAKIPAVTEMGIRVSLGHSAADYAMACKAFEAGASQITHIFNCCPPLEHREPGLVGAALDSKNVYCEVISDGVHLHPAIVRLLHRLLGPDRMVLVSDAISATGLTDGEYNLAGLCVYVKEGQARLQDGRLAGSTVTLYEAALRAVKFGIPLADVVKMASITPARALGLDAAIGSLEPGKDADILVLNKDLSIKYVFYKGKQVV